MAQSEDRKERYKIVSFELRNEFYKELEMAAIRGRTSKSEVIRTALRSYLKR